MLTENLNKYPRGCAVIDTNAVKNNIYKISEQIGPANKLICVIKSNGYGHGAVQLANIYEAMEQVYGYAVATAEEAFELRDANINKPILILGYCFPYSYERIVKEDIRLAVFREDEADQLNEAAKKLNKKALIHIKTDTGMGRIGVTPDECGIKFAEYCLNKDNLSIEGVFTHMSKADEIDKEYANLQILRFKTFTDEIEKKLNINIPIKHIANSAGIIDLEAAREFDLCRAGIILYGLVPSNEVDIKKIGLTPILSLYSHITYIKTRPEGSMISYGGIYKCKKETRIATVPLGYADGYPRSLTGKGFVLICGKKAPIIGKICMDQFMVDVTDIPEAREGDLVTLIGKDGEEEITLDYISDLSGRFNYEFACLLTDRIKRVYE